MTPSERDFFNYRYTRGIVREVSTEIVGALAENNTAAEISLERARHEHERYIQVLGDLGIETVVLPADPNLPDGVFVEDTAVILPGLAVITNPGASTRQGEVDSVEAALSTFIKTRRLGGGGTLDGGDVLRIGNKYFIGISQRTNIEGAEELRTILMERGLTAEFIEFTGALHLKTLVTPLSPDTIIGAGDVLNHPAITKLSGLKIIVVPKSEAPAANVLAVNGRVLVPGGFPETLGRIITAGFDVIDIGNFEFMKADGGLTCRSVLW